MTTNQTATAPTDEYLPAPERRLVMPDQSPEFYRAMIGLERAAKAGVDPVLGELIRIHASIVNGCAFCLDMHITDARKLGIEDHRIYSLPAWRETPYYTARERAALALTEAVTKVTEGHVPDAVYDAAAEHFEPQQLAQLIALIITINSWNRIAISTRMSPAPKES